MYLKKILLIFISCLLCNALQSQKISYNYLDGYYEDMYNAYYAYKVEKDSAKAYAILNGLNRKFKLLYTPLYYENVIYFELCMKMGDKKNAKSIATELVRDYGWTLEWLQEISPKSANIFDTNEYTSLLIEFNKQKDTLLIQEIALILESDQRYRGILQDARLKKIQSYYIDSLWGLTNYIDSINDIKLRKILKKNYPTLAQTGGYMELMNLSAVFWHIRDTAYFAPILLEYIKQGKCRPELLAKMIDRNKLSDSRKDRFIYGIYGNATKEDIYDYPNLNKRRINIGLPTIEMQKKFDEIREKEQ